MGRLAQASLVAFAVACTDQSDDIASGFAGRDAGSTAAAPTSSGVGSSPPDAGGATADGGATDPHPLRTGLVASQTGVSVDAFDGAVVAATVKYHEPDAMIFKAIIYVESRFDKTSVACPNLPCGMPAGWTDGESRCYGLMQIVPACTSSPKLVLLPNGHPNLTQDAASSDYAGSVFNPDVNVDVGVAGIADNRAQVVKAFPGCTVDQYTMMAVGNYNSYGSTKSCTVYNVDYTKGVLDAYRQYATAAGYVAHPY